MKDYGDGAVNYIDIAIDAVMLIVMAAIAGVMLVAFVGGLR